MAQSGVMAAYMMAGSSDKQVASKGKMSGWLSKKGKKTSWFSGGSSTWKRGYWVLDYDELTIEEYSDDKQSSLSSEDDSLHLQASDETARDRWANGFREFVQQFQEDERKSESSKEDGDEATQKKERKKLRSRVSGLVPKALNDRKKSLTSLALGSLVGGGRKSNLQQQEKDVARSEASAMLSRRASSADTNFSLQNPTTGQESSAQAAPPSKLQPSRSAVLKVSTTGNNTATTAEPLSASRDPDTPLSSRPQSTAGARVGRQQQEVNQLDMTKNFMSKARNFAISINKDFLESAKKKGVYNPVEAATLGDQRSKQRAAVVPVNAPEEKIDRTRVKKSPAQNEMLVQVVLKEFAGLFGGNLLKEVDSQSIVDLMYTVKVPKDHVIVLQGEATDRMFVVDSGIVGVYTQDFVDRPPEFEIEKRAGDSFGVLSLIYNQPAPFMIKSHSDCVLWALPSRKFHELSTNENKRRLARKVRLLDRVPLIADNVDFDAMAQLADSMEFREFAKGDYVLKKGDELKQVLVIAEGFARISGSGEDEEGLLAKGDVFGEWALLGKVYQSEFSIQAESSSLSILCLDTEDVEELVGPLRQFVLAKWMERQQQVEESNNNSAATSPRPLTPPRSATPPMLPSPHEVKRSLVIRSTMDGDNAAQGEKVKRSQVGGGIRSTMDSDSGSTKNMRSTLVRLTADDSVTATKGSMRKLTAVRPSMAQPTTTPLIQPERSPSAVELLSREEEEMALEIVASEVRKNENLARRTRAATRLTAHKDPSSSPTGSTLEITPEMDNDDDERGAENLDKPFIRSKHPRPEIDNDKLEFKALLGSGNFGKVHLVQNTDKPTELFALKVLTRHYIVLNGWEKMVENERDAMLELSTLVQSPFLLKLFNSFTDSKNIYLLLELCEGGDLYNLMRATKARKFGEDNARFYFGCVVLGLEAMQSRDIVYRDLKPENLMIDKQGYIKIADFGLAKKTLRTFSVCGTPEYMAPEVIMSRGHGLAVDWWAAGIMLYEILHGSTPFAGGESMDVYERILALRTPEDVPFPAEDDTCFSPQAVDLIRHLMHPKKNKRLGVKYPGIDAVKAHDFFKGFDWQALSKLEMAPPVIPTTTHIDKLLETRDSKPYDPRLYGAPDDHSGWTLAF